MCQPDGTVTGGACEGQAVGVDTHVDTLPPKSVTVTLTLSGAPGEAIVDSLPSASFSEQFRTDFAAACHVEASQVRIQSISAAASSFDVGVAILPSVLGEGMDAARLGIVLGDPHTLGGHNLFASGPIETVQDSVVVPTEPAPAPADEGPSMPLIAVRVHRVLRTTKAVS